MPGAMMRKAREKSFESLRAALTACQAMSIAITVVLPLPVAIFMAMRKSSGLASSLALPIWSNMPFEAARLGATSVSQINVSTASTWQKNGCGPTYL
jgi:hypothetical protein